MIDKGTVGLWEAYLQVHQPKEEVEQLDESGLSQDTIRSAVKQRQKRVDAAYREDTPEGDTRGDEGMKKLARSKRQLDINKPREVRMRANEEVENWVNSLIDEGYDLSEYTWDDMYEIYINENRAAARDPEGYEENERRRQSFRQRRMNDPHTGINSPAFQEFMNRQMGRPKPKKKKIEEETDLFDAILEHLVAEGYADTNESALVIMANMSEEWRQDIMEISRKTATRAYAQSATGEFEGADDAKDIRRTDNLRKHIERKFGPEAAADADKHADASTFGRTDPRTGKRQPKPQSRFQNPNKYRTTKSGKMHGQDQNALKAKLKKRMG